MMKVEMREWQSEFIPNIDLGSNEAKESAAQLTEKGIVKLIELKNGLEITTNSFVGNVSIGDLQLTISPKINGIQLFTLLNYAYELNDLKILHESSFNLNSFQFLDIIIYQLYLNTEDLFLRGFHRGYVKKEEELSSPRGRLNFSQYTKTVHLQKTTLPCTYYERNEDNLLNQVLLAGLKLSIRYVQNKKLKLNLQRLCSYLQDYISSVKLNRQLLQKAYSNVNRLTERYRPLLTIVSILYDAEGVQLEGTNRTATLQGFFFDMNLFFEKLVEKLIHDYIQEYSLREQFQLHEMFRYVPGFNPIRQKSPTPRPDFALMRKNKVVKLMDAKYKDLWKFPLPSHMLYQLAIYALSSEGDKTATIIYPSEVEAASTQKIDINNPTTNEKMGTVILKPINLNLIAKYLQNRDQNRNNLIAYMNSVIFVD